MQKCRKNMDFLVVNFEKCRQCDPRICDQTCTMFWWEWKRSSSKLRGSQLKDLSSKKLLLDLLLTLLEPLPRVGQKYMGECSKRQKMEYDTFTNYALRSGKIMWNIESTMTFQGNRREYLWNKSRNRSSSMISSNVGIWSRNSAFTFTFFRLRCAAGATSLS